ncbi:hypothetical protein G7Y89_g496 [Cudoniella acicularis]|uniref:Uncharacterized protein n=1 Tax=Cudoniella acicularis TaxID=354080 RepID=A0A8H4RY15_9HELO|nr:hypothetical protein G7Y89_g496 [Cudoniella acicularis]
MAQLKRRFGASIVLTVLSLSTVILLLYRSNVKTQLQKIGLGTSLDEYTGLWSWGAEADEDGESELRIIVFGDSWVDDRLSDNEAERGKGKSWARIMCEEINCTTFINYAATQPPDAFPVSPPTGVLTSNSIQVAALASSQSMNIEGSELTLLPDFASQVQSFLAEPAPVKPTETIFVLSLGFWDVYNYASLDFAFAQNRTDATIEELFNQLELLYSHYAQNLSVPVTILKADGRETTAPSSFHVVVPKVVDPSLLPGWLSHRPLPMKPSSIAEQQKNVMYLTNRWNTALENKLTSWLKSPSIAADSKKFPQIKAEVETGEKSDSEEKTPDPIDEIVVEKDAYWYDLPEYLLKMIVEFQLEDEEISDASGLGKGSTPFEHVYQPCIHETQIEENEPSVDVNGQLLCTNPEQYLFWDAFNIGSVAKKDIGKAISTMVKDGQSLRQIWGQLYGNTKGGLRRFK